jgi:hypothetical protein
MTIQLTISPELEARLLEEARRRGISTEDYTRHVLDQHVPAQDRSAAAVALIQSWIDGADEAEQKRVGNLLARVIDEDRLSDRKLFPPELEGVTW